MKKIKNILVVCTGNSCRSIMAEAYFKKCIEEKKLSMKVQSAGTHGMKGVKPPEETIKMLLTEQISPDGYESKPVTEELAKWADVIFVMEPMHKEYLIDRMPNEEQKIYLLAEVNSEESDIVPDPIGRSLAFYRLSFRLIKDSVNKVLENIQTMNGLGIED